MSPTGEVWQERYRRPGWDQPGVRDGLRECDYGRLNGTRDVGAHASRLPYLDEAYPRGESWRAAVERIGRFLDDLPTRWAGTRVLVVGHVATRWGLEHHINGAPLERLAGEDFAWQPGWEYDIS